MNGREPDRTRWIRSSRSGDNGGNCVEAILGFPGVVPVRDSKNPDGPVLVIGRTAWAAFTAPLSR
ncbi:DUF397 domain-containing protein [Streptomyces sp. SID8352]|uniref:DUF397 domain-containing protein n=1 Tax=Streptomyces sp. SID8352 TaxID=2690338 RepID=UPI001371B4D1|nr:DUF397 domain-containing protein [Streptomyces sp. SID8352]